MMEGTVVSESTTIIRVAAICGSLRRASFNRGLIRYAKKLCEEDISGMHIELVDIGSLPLLNTDLEIDGGYPPVVDSFRRKILEADSILFASPEYNYSLSAPLKNAIDWASRPPNVMAGKSAAVVSAAGGSAGQRSQYHLRQVGVFLDLHFINKPELFILGHKPPKKFDSDGNLIDSEIQQRLKELLLSLQSFTCRLQRGNTNTID
ncbi:hypothetical protein KFK09_015318 [Dendrobium nobile]|uniref:NAD(P)H dehydrogenase (quinone) n=1 Tax=Dendrobium nobile TaxID=94219 RepID=A0A8T3BA63_DENNO|nr:hypothetical protein KFK09_015318 [Dendrobium nobile]